MVLSVGQHLIPGYFIFVTPAPVFLLQDSEQGSNLNREMDSLGSIHSIPSVSVSTGSRSSSVNSMQEVMDESSPELVMMQEDEGTVNSSSSLVHKKVGMAASSLVRFGCSRQSQLSARCFQEAGFPSSNQNMV